jgi:hypothetical protein
VCVGARPSAHRRKERDFIAFGKWRHRRGKLLIQRQDHASGHLPKARKPGRVMLKNELKAAARRNLQGILAEARDVANYTEKKDADAHVADIVTDCR